MIKSKIIINGIIINHEELSNFYFQENNSKAVVRLNPTQEGKARLAEQAREPKQTTLELYNGEKLVWAKQGFDNVSVGIIYNSFEGFQEYIELSIKEGRLL